MTFPVGLLLIVLLLLMALQTARHAPPRVVARLRLIVLLNRRTPAASTREETPMERIYSNQKAVLAVDFADEDGNRVAIDGAPTFSCNPPEACTLRDLDPTQPGESPDDLPGIDPAFAKVAIPNRDWIETNGGAIGIAAVQFVVTGDADRSEGVREVAASAAAELALPEATAAVLIVRAPVHQ